MGEGDSEISSIYMDEPKTWDMPFISDLEGPRDILTGSAVANRYIYTSTRKNCRN